MAELILVLLAASLAHLVACGCGTMRCDKAIETGRDWVEARHGE